LPATIAPAGDVRTAERVWAMTHFLVFSSNLGFFLLGIESKLPGFTETEILFLMSQFKLRLADLFDDNSFL